MRHRGVEPVRQRHPQSRRPPDDPHQFVEEQDQPEGAEHVIEVIATVERPDRDDLEQHADQKRGAEREHGAGDEAAGPGHEGRREIGADHVQRTVREVHHVHDAEDQRQTRLPAETAAARSCSPLRHCSRKSSIDNPRRHHPRKRMIQSTLRLLDAPPARGMTALSARSFNRPPSPLHRAFAAETVLAVLDDRRDRLERQVALGDPSPRPADRNSGSGSGCCRTCRARAPRRSWPCASRCACRPCC